MAEPKIILDYAPRPRSRGQVVAELLARAVRYAGWLLWGRPLRAPEVFIGGWLFAAAAWAIQAIECERCQVIFTPLMYPTVLPGAVLIVALAALVRLATKRRWRAMLLCTIVALPSGIASGMLQYERCPHATYLQVFGASIPVAGRACGNPRQLEPWWLRE